MHRKTGASPNLGSFDVNNWVVGDINDDDGLTSDSYARIANMGYFNNNMVFDQQIGLGGDLDDLTTPALTNAPSAVDVMTANALNFTVGDLGLHSAATGGVAVFTDGIDVDNGSGGQYNGLLNDANGAAQPTSLSIDWNNDAGFDGVAISGINMWSRNGGMDARVFMNCHVYLDTTPDNVFNPTFYGEITTGVRGGSNSTNDWTAAYISEADGYLGDVATYGVRLDFYSVTDATTGYRSEGKAAGGSIVKEVDIFGDVVTIPSSVPNWTFFE
jgi:hypothetical protein